MSPNKNDSHSTSNRNGESVGRQANVLASAYCVDSSARLSGFRLLQILNSSFARPACTDLSQTTPLPAPAGQSGIPEVLGTQGLPSPPSSPPLAALTSANELALSSKSKVRGNGRSKAGRREGASYYIREECERLFCETMKDIFLGEEDQLSSNGSIEMDTNMNTRSTPPTEGLRSYGQNGHSASKGYHQDIDAWIEVWDYAGGCSFRGFVGGDGENKSLFAFFDSAVIGRDLKQGLMAIIELAETVFAVGQVVVCVDRSIGEIDRKAFLKSLRWVGFEMVTLDLWANSMDVTSDKWLFLGMEI